MIMSTNISLDHEQKLIYIAHAFALNNKICAKRFLTGRDSRVRFFSLLDKKRRLGIDNVDIMRTIPPSFHSIGCRIVLIAVFEK